MYAIEKGYFSSRVISNDDISIIANTSLEECSDVAVLVIDRVRDSDMSDATTMTTVTGETVINFTGSTDHYTCTPHIELPSGRRLSFPSFSCSTGKFCVGVGVSNIINSDNISFSSFMTSKLIM